MYELKILKQIIFVVKYIVLKFFVHTLYNLIRKCKTDTYVTVNLKKNQNGKMNK